jgi:hypothetical protein
MSVTGNASTGPVEALSEFVGELLDAHVDTLCLADALVDDERSDAAREWAAHVRYLQDLQRFGHEFLARLSRTDASVPSDGSSHAH